MPLTPETLTRHELNGLHAEVVDASNPDLVGIAGRVVVETRGTLHLDDGSRVRQVPKEGATFEFALPKRSDRDCRESRESGSTTNTNTNANANTDTNSDPASTRGAGSDSRTDEAAGVRKAPGTASERGRDTAGGTDAAGQSGPCEGTAYVTVDGATLLSRPALRTENAGDSQWR